ncbi:MAG: S8 family serine peptidase [Planctomycetes bacterium]|nr:S8 family serine peptidase [Planctomycetota bacterium]
MDRGIDWDHPDFIRPDGTTRIKWLFDMSLDHPAPVEFSEAQINAALLGGTPINSRDAVGHGTVTAGLAAGNGSAVTGADFRGMAPNADLIIVKVTSEGASAHGSQPAETPFNASYVAALDWVDQKITQLGQPAVGLFNSGTQYGPLDGTSAVSEKIDEVFGSNRPGRVYVAPSGDEGNLPNHAKATFDNVIPTVIGFNKPLAQTAYMPMWYSGNQPANITINFDDGTTIGPVGPHQFVNENGVRLYHFLPGANSSGQFLTSSGGDRLVYVRIVGHATGGNIVVEGLSPGTGTIDLYSTLGSGLTAAIPFTDHLTAGRLTDFATTNSAIVAGAHVLLTNYVDVNGISRQILGEGAVEDLYFQSSAGPTRDGRLHGVDITAPGHNAFAAYAQESYWNTFSFNLAEDSDGWYGRGGATSGSAPLVVGGIALLLEQFPQLTADEIRDVLHATARTDSFTGTTPNAAWGYGKLDILAALDELHGVPDSADFNGDNLVDGSDFLTWQRNAGTVGPMATHANGDANGDDQINAADLVVWELQYGSAPPLAAIAAVPEPSTCVLALAALCLAMSKRRSF